MSIQNEMARITQNVSDTYSVLEALGCDMPEQQNSDNLAKTAGTSKVVKYIEQDLTEAQKSQARDNIGLGNVDNVKQYSASNPPPYPVTSVNGYTGVITINADTIKFTAPDENDSIIPRKNINDALLAVDEYLMATPSWARESTKPTYTAAEVGADASGTAASKVAEHNTNTSTHKDIREQISQLSSEIVDLSVFVTPQMYGAVGNGEKDDTEAFENALAENDNVFVPSGKYVITRPLDLTYKKSLFSDDGQNPTIIYAGNESNSVFKIGRLAIVRNINVFIRTVPYKGVVFDTNNLDMESSTNGKHSRVEHIKVSFNSDCQEASLIGITVDSGTDANNMPICTGGCYQVYNDIVVDGGTYYGTGIKMTLIQGRAFTEETKLGFPWLTHISFNDIYLGCPYTAIKAGVENTSGSAYFKRVKMEHILFNNVTTQSMYANNTRYFLDVNHIDAFLSKCKGWDYHNVVDEAGNQLKVNIIGEGTNLSFTDTDADFGNGLLQSCDFIAENEAEFTVEESPTYFMNKYFKGTFLRNGYDSVDAKIDAKMTDEHIGDIYEEKINEILYSGYTNLMEHPLTQIKKDLRFSNSSQSWVTTDAGYLTLIIPIVKGGNIIRWKSDICRLPATFKSMFFFNDDELTKGTLIAEYDKDILVSNDGDIYLNVPNPSGYKYASIPLWYDEDLSSENMIITINQKITGSSNADSYTKYLQDNVIPPAVSTEVAKIAQPKGDYALKSEGTFFVEGSGTTDSTNKKSEWVGTSDKITSYYDGLAIRYKIGVVGQTTTTLNINNLGAKTVYLFSSTKLSTQFPMYSIINLIYHADLNGGCWMCSDYDSNTNTQQRVFVSTDNVEYPITARYNTTTGSSYYAEYGRYVEGVTLNPSTKTITATAFKGSLTGNADTATKATQDASGNVITSTYTKKTELSSHNTDASAHADIREELSQLSSEIVDLSVFVTPQMYGAAGDGVTDDTKAFEDALAANDNVFVPTGKYFITRPLNLTYKKSLVGSDNQGATLIYDGTDTDSIILIGRLSIFRNINITVKKSAFKGVVLDTNNTKIPSSSFGLNSRVEHITVKFNEDSPEARLIRIIVDSGTDANNMPLLTGICYQTFKDIIVDSASYAYGCGIEMTLVQGRAFTEETKEGFPWITHISFDDISLGSPYRAIKAGVNNTSGSEYFNRISIGHILFNNVYTQYYGVDKTRYFFDVEHFEAYLTKCMAWDYHPLGLAGEKCNIIGEDVNLSLNDCEMVFGVDLLESCDFTAEVNSGFTVKDQPTYFTDKYFRGTFLRNGYDIVDAKIDTKLTGSYVANIAEEKINEILYSGYANVMDDPLTQIKVGYYYSNSNKDWKAQSGFVTIIIPIVKGGNIVRWASSKPYDIGMNNAVYLFGNDELTDGVHVDSVDKLLNSDNGDQYLTINNPNGLKYASIPFYEYDMPDETMIMTINREITGSGGESYIEHLRNSVINPAIENTAATKSEGSFFIEGSGATDSTAKTSTWVGTSDRITEYYDGLAIRYKIGVAGQSTTTLNINNLGAKTVYLFNTTKLTTQFPVNSIINLIYHADLNSGCWVCSDYDSNTNTYQRIYPSTDNVEYPITARYNTTTGSSYYAEYGRYSTSVTLNPSTNTITATTFKGKLTGNADTATKATQDASGNNIASTYAKKSNAETWTFTLVDGTTVTKKVVLG